MHIFKKLLILLIIIASFVIIHRLLKENAEVKEQIDKQIVEGFNNQARELTLKPISEKYLDFPLREFMIKSSYNSAIIDKTASTDAIDFVLKRGCRLIDFEIHTRKINSAKETEFVTYSNDPEYRSIETGLTLTLEKALLFVAANAFSGLSPLPNDPLFIQLRFKNNSKESFNRTSKAITTTFGDRLYKKTVTGSTPIKEIMGKVIIVLDAISSRNYENQANCLANELNCIPYTEYVGLVSGTVDLPKYSYTEYYDLTSAPVMVAKTNRTDVSRFIMVTPPDIDANTEMMPDVVNLKRLPVQMLLVPFYKQTDKLKKYEEIFNKCGSAFCPLGPFIQNA